MRQQIDRVKPELPRRRMSAHLRGFFASNAANDLLDPCFAGNRLETTRQSKLLDEVEFRRHVKNVFERRLPGIPFIVLKPVGLSGSASDASSSAIASGESRLLTPLSQVSG